MRVVTRAGADEAACLAARLIKELLDVRPNALLGFATGRTMVPVYGELARLHRTGAFDARSCRSFNLDEYVGLHADDPQSFRFFMWHHLEAVNIARSRMHVPEGDADDPEAEAARYERLIEEAGGIDVQLLGIGDNGHIGFNEPGTAFDSPTRVATLTGDTRRQNAAAFGGADFVPPRAITMGIGTILRARRIVLLVTGIAKADALARAVEEAPTEAVPGSALQLHGDCVVVADAAAASRLKEKAGLCPDPPKTESLWTSFD